MSISFLLLKVDPPGLEPVPIAIGTLIMSLYILLVVLQSFQGAFLNS